ncbi:MAG: chitobiase/beta-hexosaminidase C-terminal domain-containing protein [Candidatus Cryptobacteroides sp.]|nr:chitobiase/beta-hexosaminidase C-terminal domain-containing protein [Candidatus Cryptobacteroides sp.]
MKNLKTFALIALSLLGFAACQQEEINHNDDQKTHTVTFVAGAPETKTTVSIEGKTAKFAWTKDDEDRITVYENGTAATETIGVLGEDGKMTLSATFDGTTPASPSYQALYNTAVSSTQTANDLYDETADVLVSAVLNDIDREAVSYFSFKRESAIAKMTLKGLTDGAFVSSVTINSDKAIAGTYDLANGSFSSTSNSITITSLSEITGGEATVWFASVPVEDATFTVTATAVDNDENVVATYTKTFSKTITLTRGDVTSFGVAMVKDASKTYGYQKISDVSDYTPGDYIILAHVYKEGCPTTGDFAIANDLSLSSQKLLGKEVTNLIDNDVISVSDGASYKLSLSGDRDNIVISNGTNILAYKSSTDFVLDGDNKYWTLSLNDGNGGTFQLLNNSTATADTKRALLFQSYSTSGSTKTASLKFGAYAAGNINNVDYAAIELYKYQEVTPPTPKYSITFAEVTGGTLSASPVKAEAGAEITLTATPDEGYAFNDDWTVKDADEAVIPINEGKFTMPAKDVTVSGSFSKVDYTITKATCEGGSFTVKKNGVEVTKAQIGESITLTASAAEGYEFDSWTVTNESTSKTVYVNENTFTMPGANITVKANFVELAVVPVYASLEELVNAGEPTTEGTYVTVTLTNDEITGIYTTSKGYRNGIYFKVGTQEVEIYCQNVPESWVIGGYVSGTLTNCAWKLYSSTWELCPADWTELTYAAPCATPVITLKGAEASITCATEGATVRYTVDGNDPTETSDIYTKSVSLTEGQTIKAKAFLEGHKASDVASATYSSSVEPASYEWDLTTASNDWTNSGCVSYFSQPYGIKKVNAYIVNKSIDDFTKATPSAISVSVKSLCNGATTSKLTVYLVNSNGDVVGSGIEITPDNASAASKTTYKEVVFNSSLAGATGIMVKCTTFGKNVLINGVKYTVTY